MSIARSYAYVLYNYPLDEAGGEQCLRVIAMGVYTLCKEFHINRYYDLDYLLYYDKNVKDKIRLLKNKGKTKDKITRIFYNTLVEALTRKYKQKQFTIHGMQAELYSSKHKLHKYFCTEYKGAVLKRYTPPSVKLPEPMNLRKVRRWVSYNFHNLKNEPTVVQERILTAIHELVNVAHIDRYDDLNYYIYYANHKARIGIDHIYDEKQVGKPKNKEIAPTQTKISKNMIAVLSEMSVHRFTDRWSVYVEIKTELFYKYLMKHIVEKQLPNDPMETLAWLQSQIGSNKPFEL